MKKLAKKLPMALISGVLVAYVVWSTDWTDVLAIVKTVSWYWLVWLAVTAPLLVAVSVWKWKRLLAVRGVQAKFGSLFAMYVAGQFYNNLLPTSSGGDVVRGEMLRRRCGCGNLAFGSIVAERFTGLAVLILLALVSLVEAQAIWPYWKLVLGVGAGLAFATAVMVIVISRRVTRTLDRVFGHVGVARKALDKVHAFQDSLWEYARFKRELWIALALSVLFYLLCVAGTVVAAEAVGQHAGFWAVSVCVPLVLIITLLPISMNGIGLWELAFAETFEAMGMTRELGLTVALLLRARDLSWSVLGYIGLTLGGFSLLGPKSERSKSTGDAASEPAAATPNPPVGMA